MPWEARRAIDGPGERGRPLRYACRPRWGCPHMSELQDLSSLIRSNTPLIVIETPDEARVVDLFRHVLANVWRALYRWSITEGLCRMDMDREDPPETAPDITTTLQAIKGADQRGIYLLFDVMPYLGYATTQRMLREILDR